MTEFEGVPYNPEEFEIRCVAGRKFLYYIGNEMDGIKIKIPEGLESIYNMFSNNERLLTPPRIPYGVEDCEGAFCGCTKLHFPPDLPETVTNTDYMFNSCVSLDHPAILPDGIQSCKSMYGRCIRLFKLYRVYDPIMLSKLAKDGIATVPSNLPALDLQECNTFT